MNDDPVVEPLVDEQKLLIRNILGGAPVIIKYYYPVFIYFIYKLPHLLEADDSLRWNLLFDAQ